MKQAQLLRVARTCNHSTQLVAGRRPQKLEIPTIQLTRHECHIANSCHIATQMEAAASSTNHGTSGCLHQLAFRQFKSAAAASINT